ncbi:hypothetical protein EHM69_01430 [candidate division KSB1 bacterium]|nr:MAG: hypothetical protein EHM69_01430 [candidate division KSB1 bacterium]
MIWVTRWVLPVAFAVIGIAILSGLILTALPPSTGLRAVLGVVTILFGVYRFAASRAVRDDRRRRYGGSHKRPWEES